MEVTCEGTDLEVGAAGDAGAALPSAWGGANRAGLRVNLGWCEVEEVKYLANGGRRAVAVADADGD